MLMNQDLKLQRESVYFECLENKI